MEKKIKTITSLLIEKYFTWNKSPVGKANFRMDLGIKSEMVNFLFNYLIRVVVFHTDTFMSSHSLFLRGRWDSSFFPRKAPGFVKVLRKVPRFWKKIPGFIKVPRKDLATRIGPGLLYWKYYYTTEGSYGGLKKF